MLTNGKCWLLQSSVQIALHFKRKRIIIHSHHMIVWLFVCSGGSIFDGKINNFVLPHCRPNYFRFWCHFSQHRATPLTGLMLTVALTPMPQTILAVVQRNKCQWPTRWAKFLSTTANASSCTASMISTTFCAVLGFHFIQSKHAQMPKCVGSFIHYSFVGWGCCCYRSSTSLWLTPSHTQVPPPERSYL